ncbi:HAMP domain-containing sensor histidine kinase [Kiloniella laminariae]|uniref:histidine kinase n=1 Tax=Kiloniella laminariae TaxID=454162 RepID=A0ABT4LK94_9PROT|nr:HAMP domain-containing sensor histidine kinase [Kiloniella laminariae]MCZ4281530.1 HAMP domain-containing sensor histidine kinase [Kiloniella laminariae]
MKNDQEYRLTPVVLLSDDENFSSDFLGVLRDTGFQNVSSCTGSHADEKAAPGLLFFDSRTKPGPARELLKQILALSSAHRCPVIYLDRDFQQTNVDGFNPGCDDVLHYPQSLYRLETCCQTLLRMARERQKWDEKKRQLESELEKKSEKADQALILLQQAEKRLLQQNPGLTSQNQERNNIVADMSHELRTPLNAILGFSEIMKEQAFGALGHEKYLGYAGDIHKASQHLLGIVNDVLDIAKADSEAPVLELSDVSVKDAVSDTFRMMAVLAEEAGVELSLNIPADFPDLKTDERRFRQVLTNLVSNAVKFTRPGGRVSVEGMYSDEDGAILMIIRDNGIGMSPAELAIALTPYGQIEKAQSNTHVRGTGLGLPVSKKAVEALGGDFHITSEPGLGTAVTLRFPSYLVVG